LYKDISNPILYASNKRISSNDNILHEKTQFLTKKKSQNVQLFFRHPIQFKTQLIYSIKYRKWECFRDKKEDSWSNEQGVSQKWHFYDFGASFCKKISNFHQNNIIGGFYTRNCVHYRPCKRFMTKILAMISKFSYLKIWILDKLETIKTQNWICLIFRQFQQLKRSTTV
jgi:hypothetical protein